MSYTEVILNNSKTKVKMQYTKASVMSSPEAPHIISHFYVWTEFSTKSWVKQRQKHKDEILGSVLTQNEDVRKRVRGKSVSPEQFGQ